jgi:hypothetical protein
MRCRRLPAAANGCLRSNFVVPRSSTKSVDALAPGIALGTGSRSSVRRSRRCIDRRIVEAPDPDDEPTTEALASTPPGRAGAPPSLPSPDGAPTTSTGCADAAVVSSKLTSRIGPGARTWRRNAHIRSAQSSPISVATASGVSTVGRWTISVGVAVSCDGRPGSASAATAMSASALAAVMATSARGRCVPSPQSPAP